VKLIVAEYHGCQKEIHKGKDRLRVVNQQVTDRTFPTEIQLLRLCWNLDTHSKKITFQTWERSLSVLSKFGLMVPHT